MTEPSRGTRTDAPRGHWIAGRFVESPQAERRPSWSWLLGVLALVLLADLVLALVPAPLDPHAELEVLDQALADAQRGRTLLILGDPDQLAALPDELGVGSGVTLHTIAARTPSEVLPILAAIDEGEGEAALELVVMLELAAFGPHAPTRGRTPVLNEPWTETLHRYLPVLRHREDVDPLAATLRPAEPESESEPEPEPALAERLRGVSLDVDRAERVSLDALLDSLAARKRRATFVLPPLPDRSVAAAELDLAELSADLAARVHARARPGLALALISLDHPLFVDDHFDLAGRLGDEGRRLLARNLLHQLGLPLATRPREWSMVQPEGYDQTLVHGVARGSATGPAWTARFERPEAIASDDAGTTIVIADTGNFALRVLRGNHQFVETLAGEPGEPGLRDGPARGFALLERPRDLVVLDEAVVFVDGEGREHLRSVEHELVRTLAWEGPRCAAIDSLRRDRARARLVMLCDDDRILALDLAAQRAELLVYPRPDHDRVALEVAPEQMFWADAQGRLWLAPIDHEGQVLRPEPRFANTSQVTLPNRYMAIFPFDFDEVGLDRVVGLQWVDRYQSLLVVDLRTPLRPDDALTERVQLRLFDFETEQVWPWIKAIPHGDAHFSLNAPARILTSPFHVGSFALVERDASLLWLERERSRLVRIADGLLGVAESGYLHTSETMTDRLMPLCSRSAQQALAEYRPDRFLDRRHEPIPRRGPYLALLVSSSMSTMSDRFDTYDMARLLEYELQRELGYRDGVRLDLFHRTWPIASLADEVGKLDEFMTSGPPPDVILLEVHGFIGRFLKYSKEPGQLRSQLAQLGALAERYDSLIIFYDNSAVASHQRDGFRGTSASVANFLVEMRRLGFVVLEPSDRLMRELLVESPWGNQPWAKNGHHGSTWALELTAQALGQMAAPSIREFLRGRTPARERERDPSEFEDPDFHPLREAWQAAPIVGKRRAALPKLEREYLQVHYADRHVRVFVDLGGYADLERSEAALRELALAVVAEQIGDEVYGDLADRVTIELVEFSNYDEYGAGVLDSAERVWQRSMTTPELEVFLGSSIRE